MVKMALLIGVSKYEEGLDPLPCAAKDIEALKEVLIDSTIGGFAAADVLLNPQRQEMEEKIYELFNDRQKDDTVLLYFSGHGVLDESNNFYFATPQTRKDDQDKLNPTTVLWASTVQKYMEWSKSQRQVVILDSCFGGAFAKGLQAKDSGSVNLEKYLGGQGRAILTASTSTQYALTQDECKLSIYTRFLVEGLQGNADSLKSGWITVADLHCYARDKVRQVVSSMTPKIYPVKEGYDIILAKSPYEGKSEILKLDLTSYLQGSNAEDLLPSEEYERNLDEYKKTIIDRVFNNQDPGSQRAAIQEIIDGKKLVGLRGQDLQRIYRYAKLEALLKNAWWVEADRETHQLILIIIGTTYSVQDLSNFPRDELRLIDNLWTENSKRHYSERRFGFSVQRHIYRDICQDCGVNLDNEPSDKVWMKFADTVGWRVNDSWRDYDNLQSSDNFPKGSFPDFKVCQCRDMVRHLFLHKELSH